MSAGDQILSAPQSGSLPVNVFPSPDSVSFDPTAYIALPAIGVTSTVVSFVVPEGYHGVIRRMGNVFVGSGWTEGSGSLVWQLLANGAVIRNYDNVVSSLGAVNNPAYLGGGGGILVYEQQLVILQVNNVSLVVGGSSAGGRLSGWFFPKWRMPDDTSVF
ncbi:MAG TPA: hypothetical protein VKW06_10440 [Candidatus Angelobacter sp.]|nr:hypothetical protein [Candidatus Angelobacter sp.]